jgi:LysR family transcriptional regulator, hypochlorite-specific transcription factor HypT
MELKWLKDFVALADYGSFSKAADARYVTQPAFSRRIRALENWLGVSLVDRGQYPMALTQVGQEFVDEAKHLISEIYGNRDQLRLHHQQRESLHFFAQHTLAVSFFPKWIQNVESLVGDNLVRIQAGNLLDAVESFLSGSGDFLLCFACPIAQLERDDIDCIQVGSDQLVLVSAADRAGQPLHPLQFEQPLKLLAYPDDSFMGQLIKRECLPRTPSGLSFRPIFESALAEGLKALVMQGYGVAWLPASLVQHELEGGRLIALPAPAEGLSLKILLYRSQTPRTPEAAGFWKYIRELYNPGYS